MSLLDLHDIIAQQSNIYFQILEWLDASLAAKRDRLLVYEVVSRIKTTAAQQKACKVMLNNLICLT